MAKNLVIVESPAKAKTISKFLGSDYEIKSSFGHIRDLPSKGLNVDIENNFNPIYAVTPDKKKVVAELKKAAKDKTVWLASDEDREGEAIAWHLTQALGLDPKKTNRIVFHEITKTALEQAIKTPRTIDLNLVDAQQARRVLDRLVGYELSPVLWKKIRAGLSAGRVQSVAVRIVVDREKEIKNFKSEATYKVTAIFSKDNDQFNAELTERLKSQDLAKQTLEQLIGATFNISNIIKKPSFKSPSAPFTTSTLQQEASRRLGFSVKQTMIVAQRLYESGKITYMRTDSTSLSELALKTAEEYIIKNYGKDYHERKQFQTKNSSAQEAHEAIRPTDFNDTSAGEDDQQTKLYKLIWQRALSSQMSKANTEKTEVSIANDKSKSIFLAKGEILVFPGFMAVYTGRGEDTILPSMNKGDILELIESKASTIFSRAPARYSEASLVKKLEELGIGRPSTYAPTISVIQIRGYVEKGDLEGELTKTTSYLLKSDKLEELEESVNVGADTNKMLPTPVAELTTDFLVKYFPTIVDYDFTAKVEQQFDLVANGKEKWTKAIADFYKDFHKLVKDSEGISRQEVSKARLIGNHPKNKEPIFARFGRFGPMLQMGDSADEDKEITFAPLPEGRTMDNVTLEEALVMFELPRTLGKTKDDEDIKANIGRFGPYIQIGKTYISIKPLDPHKITLEEALEKIAEKEAKDKEKNIQIFKSGIKILNGPFGPYITDGKKNARIDKSQDPKKITEAEAKEILEKAPVKKKFKRRKK